MIAVRDFVRKNGVNTTSDGLVRLDELGLAFTDEKASWAFILSCVRRLSKPNFGKKCCDTISVRAIVLLFAIRLEMAIATYTVR